MRVWGAASAFRAQMRVEPLISATKIFKSTLGVNFAPHAHKGPCIHLAPTQMLLFFTFRGHFLFLVMEAAKPGQDRTLPTCYAEPARLSERSPTPHTSWIESLITH